jgi:hypothetical protein
MINNRYHAGLKVNTTPPGSCASARDIRGLEKKKVK